MTSINNNYLKFDNEEFIPFEMALDYLVERRPLSELKNLFVWYEGYAHSKDQGVTESDKVYLKGLAMIKHNNLAAIWPYRKQKYTQVYGSLSFCHGTLNGKKFDWFAAPKVFDVGENRFINDNNVFVKQSDIDALAEKYGIPKIDNKDESTEVQATNLILPMVESKSPDDTFRAMKFYIKVFEKENKRTPTFYELWPILLNKDLSQWGVELKTKDKKRIKARYDRYYPASTASP